MLAETPVNYICIVGETRPIDIVEPQIILLVLTGFCEL